MLIVQPFLGTVCLLTVASHSTALPVQFCLDVARGAEPPAAGGRRGRVAIVMAGACSHHISFRLLLPPATKDAQIDCGKGLQSMRPSTLHEASRAAPRGPRRPH